eukprot:COSAG06_NODE_14434_length_1155_cov_0.688091_1_plen_106_part_00
MEVSFFVEILMELARFFPEEPCRSAGATDGSSGGCVSSCSQAGAPHLGIRSPGGLPRNFNEMIDFSLFILFIAEKTPRMHPNRECTAEAAAVGACLFREGKESFR